MAKDKIEFEPVSVKDVTELLMDIFEIDDDENSKLESAIDALIKAVKETASILDEAIEKVEEDEEVKECPICGNSVSVFKDGKKWKIECNYCPLETDAVFDTKEEALEYWNSDRD